MPALQSAVVGQVRTSGHLEWATGSPARRHWVLSCACLICRPAPAISTPALADHAN